MLGGSTVVIAGRLLGCAWAKDLRVDAARFDYRSEWSRDM